MSGAHAHWVGSLDTPSHATKGKKCAKGTGSIWDRTVDGTLDAAFYILNYAKSHEVHWSQKYTQEVHEDYPIHFNDERYKIIVNPINSNNVLNFDRAVAVEKTDNNRQNSGKNLYILAVLDYIILI